MSKRKTQGCPSNVISPRNVARLEGSIAENFSEPNPPPHDFRHELSTIEVGNIVSPVVVNLNKVDVTEDSTCLVATGDSNGNCSMKAKAAEEVIECEDGKSTSADSDHSSVGNSHFSNDSKKSVDSVESLKKKPVRKSDVAISYSPVKKGSATQVRVASGPFKCMFVRFDHGSRVNEDAYLRPFTDALDNPTNGAALANELRIVQVSFL
jgi:hypothetical protein